MGWGWGWGWGGRGAEAGPHYADCVSRPDLVVCVYLYNLSISTNWLGFLPVWWLPFLETACEPKQGELGTEQLETSRDAAKRRRQC